VFGSGADSKRLHMFCSRVAVHPVSFGGQVQVRRTKNSAQGRHFLDTSLSAGSAALVFFFFTSDLLQSLRVTSIYCYDHVLQLACCLPTCNASMLVLSSTNRRTPTSTIAILNTLKHVLLSSKLSSSDM
jgi:hypothetical protein